MSAPAQRSSILQWFATNDPDRSHRAGALVFLDPDAAATAIDRAEAAGVAVLRMRGFAVRDDQAHPIDGQDLEPEGLALLDCETPSGATCGASRRALKGRWMVDPPTNGRHMILLDLDEPG